MPRRKKVTMEMLEELKDRLTEKYLVGKTRWLPERNMARSRRWKDRPLRRKHLHHTESLAPAFNVIGIGVGKRVRKGKRVNQLCLVFFVTRKVKNVKKDHLIENHLPELEGIPTDVVEVGIPRASALPGDSIGFVGHGTHAVTGTLGMYVRDAQGRVYLLSNSHVIADEGRVPPGTIVMSPGPADSGMPMPVGRLARFFPPAWNPAGNLVDCAIAEVPPPPAPPPVNTVPGIGPVLGVGQAQLGMRVAKTGRTTGTRGGMVVNVKINMVFNYPHTSAVLFTNQMCILGNPGTLFADSGDSGSVIMNAQGMVVGLLIGTGANGLCFANHIAPVLQALQVGL